MKVLIISSIVCIWVTSVLSLDLAHWLGLRGNVHLMENPASETFREPLNSSLSEITSGTASSPLIGNPLSWICFEIEGQSGPRYIESCKDAVRQLNIRSSTPALWGQRDTGHHYSVYLPQRYVSSDGRCYVEPLLRRGFDSSLTSARSLAFAGIALIQKCAAAIPPRHGAAKNLGDDDQLALVLTGWDPQVQCLGPVSQHTTQFLKNCRDILDTMNVNGAEMKFGPSAAPGGVDVTLPAELRVGYLDRCVLNVKTSGSTDMISWRVIWDVATGINAMCIRAGRSGTWNGLGSSGQISVQMSDDTVAQE